MSENKIDTKWKRTKLLTLVPTLLIVCLFMASGFDSAAIIPNSMPAEGFCGHVLDAYTLDPLVGAVVTCPGYNSTITGPDGYYQIYMGHGGSASFTVTKNGFQQWSGTGTAGGLTGWGTTDPHVAHANGLFGRVKQANGAWASNFEVRQDLSMPTTYMPSVNNYAYTDQNGLYFFSDQYSNAGGFFLFSQPNCWLHYLAIKIVVNQCTRAPDTILQPYYLYNVTTVAGFVTNTNPQITWNITVDHTVSTGYSVQMFGSMLYGLGSSYSSNVATSYGTTVHNIAGVGIEAQCLIAGVSTADPLTGKDVVVNAYVASVLGYYPQYFYSDPTSQPSGLQYAGVPGGYTDSYGHYHDGVLNFDSSNEGKGVDSSGWDVQISLNPNQYVSVGPLCLQVTRSVIQGTDNAIQISFQNSGTTQVNYNVLTNPAGGDPNSAVTTLVTHMWQR